jgi:hypothetical protein
MSAVLKAELSLALIAARGRLSKAERNLQAFFQEHEGVARSVELQHSVERERDLLVSELDEARRFLEKCEEDLRHS